ncbi:MAG: hypothetical protein EB075_01615 [Bacteroidetes bacterium]|jgi:hypothetical protein|nr:hypothetical protein [Bacteroidota bacterium]
MKLLGQRKRPWLEIKRRETDLTHLLHQSRQLHRLHDGPLDLVIDTVQTDGFYDDKRLRCHGEGLYRAYELMYPRDERVVTPEILAITGIQGIAALWCDHGSVEGQKLRITCPGGKKEAFLVYDHLKNLGFSPMYSRSAIRNPKIDFIADGADELAAALRKVLPRHKHPSLRR